ncbi:MAG: hypothetical protein AAF944_17890 [Bacteroidota bacterium]
MRDFKVNFCLNEALEKGNAGALAAESNEIRAKSGPKSPIGLDVNTP